jgi:hypothetical protein
MPENKMNDAKISGCSIAALSKGLSLTEDYI